MSKRPWDDDNADSVEADPRFRSGRWAGYWRQDVHSGRMELSLTFGGGKLFGDGRDPVGDFVLSGSYDLKHGTCIIHKAYLGQHGVDYEGMAQADGIRGSWRIFDAQSGLIDAAGPFHIWPIAGANAESLVEQAAEPVSRFIADKKTK